MPVGLIMINTLRHRSVDIHKFGWYAISTIIVLEAVAMAFPNTILYIDDSPLILITATAFVGHLVLLALSREGPIKMLQIVRYDIVLYLATISLILWKVYS
jgi:hypothetical protein